MPEIQPLHSNLIDVLRTSRFARHMVELRERADQGESAAALTLGEIYFRGGDGIHKDCSAARYWFERVDLNYDGTAYPAWRLGVMYFKGQGGPKDINRAAKYFRKAVLRGHYPSRMLLAILYKKGAGSVDKSRTSETILRSTVSNSELKISMRLIASMWLSIFTKPFQVK